MFKFQCTPLEKMKLTQAYGIDLVGGDFYAKVGLKKGHNGWDLSAPLNTEVFSVMAGTAYIEDTGGYGKNVRVRSRTLALEAVYAHLSGFRVTNGQDVKVGDCVGLSGNTGLSTGPHLHFGIRPTAYIDETSSHHYPLYDNGYWGYVDPAPYFQDDVFALPVDKRYGLKKRGMNELQWYAANAYFFRTQRRLMTPREKNALVYGYWDLRTVLDPAMFTVWANMTKPEYLSRRQ